MKFPFGFDLNGDGHISPMEHMHQVQMWQNATKKYYGGPGIYGTRTPDPEPITEPAEYEAEYEEYDETEEQRQELEALIAELREQLEPLNAARESLEEHEPDILDPVYDAWFDYRTALDDRISDLELEIRLKEIDLEYL